MTVTTYSGNLVAFLTFPQLEFPINTVERLLERGEEGVSWGLLAGSVIESYLREAEDPHWRHIEQAAVRQSSSFTL